MSAVNDESNDDITDYSSFMNLDFGDDFGDIDYATICGDTELVEDQELNPATSSGPPAQGTEEKALEATESPMHTARRRHVFQTYFETAFKNFQRPPIVNHNQNTFDDFPDETKDVPLFDPAPRYQEEFQEPIEQVEVHLFVYDVDRRDEPDEIPAHGPVSVQRVSASYNDLAPYFGDIIGFKEIGFVRKTDIAEAKRNLSAEYMKSLILPFNCCLDYKQWTVRNGRHVKIDSSVISSAPSDAPSSQEANCWSVESQKQETPALSAASEDANYDTFSLLMKLDLGEVLKDFDYRELHGFDFGDAELVEEQEEPIGYNWSPMMSQRLEDDIRNGSETCLKNEEEQMAKRLVKLRAANAAAEIDEEAQEQPNPTTKDNSIILIGSLNNICL
ncbi:hypothetical protein B9Z55_021512 [Caenorhabditis nigoni]|uniref:Uncharacterized protein n=1 Tax=Caenorhabditis nigoni TaxID=1611254 RepID=A0A2G5TSF4_9PELO|nr:hypothetical protein B9Z55_021512 [Caenorhabditis nigoni]